MELYMINLLAVLSMSVVLFLRGSDGRLAKDKTAWWVATSAFIAMCVFAVYNLYLGFTLRDIGFLSGVFFLVWGVLCLMLAFLAWRRPCDGGLILIALAGLLVLYHYMKDLANLEYNLRMGVIVTGVPYFIGFGLWFLLAGLLARRKRTHETPK